MIGDFTLILHHSDSEKEKIFLEESTTIFIPVNVGHQLITDKNKDLEIFFCSFYVAGIVLLIY